jgi:hypothetical protein
MTWTFLRLERTLDHPAVPGERPMAKIGKVYGRDHALKVVTAAMDDCNAAFLGGKRE